MCVCVCVCVCDNLIVGRLMICTFGSLCPKKTKVPKCLLNRGLAQGFLSSQRHLRNSREERQFFSSFPQQALGPCVELGQFGLNGKIDHLRHDMLVLMMALVKLKEQY